MTDKAKAKIAQIVAAQAQSSIKVGTEEDSCSLRKIPTSKPETPIGRKNTRLPLLNSRMQRTKPIISQALLLKRNSSGRIIFNIFQ